MQKFVSSNRLTTQVNDLLADISLVRSESIKRNGAAGICASTNGTSCTASGNWASGWLGYYDNSGTKVVLKVHEALSGGNTLKAEQTDASTSTTTAVDTVAYSKSGAFSSTAFTYKFTLCDPQRKQFKMIDITVVGQTSISSGSGAC